MNFIYSDSPHFPEIENLVYTEQDWDTRVKLLQAIEQDALKFKVNELAILCQKLQLIQIQQPESSYADNLKELLYNDIESDVVFTFPEGMIPSHRFILAARSSFFKAMWLSGLREANDKIVDMSQVSYNTFKAILEFVYTGDVKEITSDIAVDLLVYSCVYDLGGLTMIMESVVGFSTDIDNAACLFELCYTYNCERLLDALYFFIMNNWKSVKRTDAWSGLDLKYKNVLLEKANEWNISLQK